MDWQDIQDSPGEIFDIEREIEDIMMTKERMDHLDRMISKLRKEQVGLIEEWNQLEMVICDYEKEADRIEGIINDENNQ